MSKTTVFVSGTVYWAKIVGDRALHPNYEGDAREWSYEFEPDDTSFLKEAGLLDRLKEPRGDNPGNRGAYLVLKKPEFNAEGKKNDPFRIYNGDDTPWDETKLIGNGSKVDVKLDIRDWGRGKKKSIYTTAIRVTDLVPYESNEFAGMNKDDVKKAPSKRAAPASKAKPQSAELDADLDDDIPFD